MLRTTHADRRHLPIWPYTARFARSESHTKAGVICPSLALLASAAPWWQIWAPPSGKTLLASLAQNHIRRQASSAHRSRCSLVTPPSGSSGRHQWQDTARFARAESHTKTGVIHPSLALLASGAPWWQIWAPPSGKTQLASLAQNHIPRQASSAHRSRCLLVAPPGGRSGRHLVAR